MRRVSKVRPRIDSDDSTLKTGRNLLTKHVATIWSQIDRTKDSVGPTDLTLTTSTSFRIWEVIGITMWTGSHNRRRMWGEI